MINIKQLLATDAPYIHIASCQSDILARIEDLKNEDMFVAKINGNNTSNQKKLFKEFAKQFHFPDYFSWNWDSFDEIINDLDWINKRSYTVIISNSDDFLEGRFLMNKSLEYTFWETLSESILEWNKGRNYDDFPTPPTPFHVVLLVSEDNKLKSAQRIQEITNLDVNII